MSSASLSEHVTEIHFVIRTRAILFRSLRVKHYNDWAPFIAWLRGHPAHATTAETLTVHSSPRSDGLDTALTLLPCLTTLILVVGLPWNYTLPASSSIVHLQLPDQGHPTRRQIPSDVTHVALNELCGGVTSRHLQKWLTTGALSLTSLTHLSLNFFFDSKDGISAWPSFPQFAGTISGWLPATCRVCILTTRSASTLYMCTGEMMPWVCGKRDDRLVFASHLARGHSIPRGPGLDWTRFILVWKEKEIRFDGPHGHWADAVAIQDERRQWTLDAI